MLFIWYGTRTKLLHIFNDSHDFMDQVKVTLQPLLCHKVQDYQAVTPQKIHLKHTATLAGRLQ